MNTHLGSPRRSFAALAVAALLSALVAGCAQAPGDADDAPGSGSSVPPQIDYHGFPYNIPAGAS